MGLMPLLLLFIFWSIVALQYSCVSFGALIKEILEESLTTSAMYTGKKAFINIYFASVNYKLALTKNIAND